MKNYTLIIFAILFLSAAFSCKKEKVTKDHPEFVGDWAEQTNDTKYYKLHIESESKGILSIYTVGNSDSEDHQLRKWRIKDNTLFYGVESNLGEISQYPTTATADIALGFNNDTIKTGTKYMILNHRYYTLSTN